MSSPLMPPIKMLTPIPEDDEMPKYKYFVQFDPIVDEYTGEEVANLLRQVYNHLVHISLLLSSHHCHSALHNWVMHIHDALPSQFRISNWYCTIAHMVPEPNAPFPGEDGFNMDDPLTPLESYLLQHAIPEGALLRLGLVANNKDFPGHVFDRFPTPLPDTAEDEEVIVFESPPKKESFSTPTRSQATSSTTPALPVPPRSMHSQKTPISLVPPVANLPGVSPSPCHFLHVHALGMVLSLPVSPPSLLASCWAPLLWSSFSPIKPLGLYCCPTGMTPVTLSQRAMPAAQSTSLSCGLQNIASSIQDLCQALLNPGSGVGLHGSDSTGTTAPATNNITTPSSKAAPLDVLCSEPSLSGPTGHPLDICCPVPPLPPILGQGDFAGVQPLSPVHKAPAAPTTPPPPLPEEEQPSTIVEELPPPGDSMDVDAPPSPPRVYHLVTDTLLHSRSLVVCSPSPEASPSNCGDKIQQRKKQKKKKAKGKGKAVVLSPKPSPPVTAASANITTSLSHEEPPSPLKKVLKRKHAPLKTVPSEPGPFKSTYARVATPTTAVIPSDTEASNAICPTIKKPHFSPKKASKKKSSHKTTKSTISDALPDSNWMFLGHPKQQYLAAELTQAQDPGQEGIPIDRHNSCAELENYQFGNLVTVPDEFSEATRIALTVLVLCTTPTMRMLLIIMRRLAFPVHTVKPTAPGTIGFQVPTATSVGRDVTAAAPLTIPPVRCMRLPRVSQLLHAITFLLRSINHKLEHINYLYHGCLHALNHVVCDIAESLDQFASAEGGNELIEDLSHIYREVCSFISISRSS
ncbi:hypothetical protein ARMGADRAFT_1027331 [Armillaria gallica]|uniref:Uncharacterized protein n=1 Tax=Armillaria gallica TaxID=47427 RepID=A0A2H3E469_ARMGA|nr:hypothetical protein ARMGADRAFT_1027331 [Armillaria gallica]